MLQSFNLKQEMARQGLSDYQMACITNICENIRQLQEFMILLNKENEALRARCMPGSGYSKVKHVPSGTADNKDITAALISAVSLLEQPATGKDIVDHVITNFGDLLPINIIDAHSFLKRRLKRACEDGLLEATNGKAGYRDTIYIIKKP